MLWIPKSRVENFLKQSVNIFITPLYSVLRETNKVSIHVKAPARLLGLPLGRSAH